MKVKLLLFTLISWRPVDVISSLHWSFFFANCEWMSVELWHCHWALKVWIIDFFDRIALFFVKVRERQTSLMVFSKTRLVLQLMLDKDNNW